MKDKGIILLAIEELKSESTKVDISDILINLRIPNENDRRRIRDKLVVHGFASWDESNHWLLTITAKGTAVNASDLDRNGNFKQEKVYWRTLRATLLTTCAGAILGAAISLIPKYIPGNAANSTIVLPPIQVVHDTVYLIKPGTSK